ncbi:interleukin-10 receptor subunit beta-like isoform X2 [Polyodon spathula]|uniref:interleukin-10 receptor subunit beta-like isoform X2 n=1 Tax=Polyodon spathula TaxID=7913 RepID=UPI001B7E6780|nr:interleukin-10 receptor subunit beta-like isoform X2 [Polyodon spathula]
MNWLFSMILMCCWCCPLLAMGWLLPPSNIKLLSENLFAVLHWEPAPGHPADTNYTVEIRKLKEDQYIQVDGCISVPSTHCDLSLTCEDTSALYFIRVRATWNGNSSNWTDYLQFNPYQDTTVSPPTVFLSAQGRSIRVDVHLPRTPFKHENSLQLKTIRHFFTLKCTIQLRIDDNTIQSTVLTNISDNMTYTFDDLNPKDRYCIISMISAYKDSDWSHKECVSLITEQGPSVSLLLLLSVVPVILFFLAVAVVVFFRQYIFPRRSELQIPKTLSMEWDPVGDNISFLSAPGSGSGTALLGIQEISSDPRQADSGEVCYHSNGFYETLLENGAFTGSVLSSGQSRDPDYTHEEGYSEEQLSTTANASEFYSKTSPYGTESLSQGSVSAEESEFRKSPVLRAEVKEQPAGPGLDARPLIDIPLYSVKLSATKGVELFLGGISRASAAENSAKVQPGSFHCSRDGEDTPSSKKQQLTLTLPQLDSSPVLTVSQASEMYQMDSRVPESETCGESQSSTVLGDPAHASGYEWRPFPSEYSPRTGVVLGSVRLNTFQFQDWGM